jgi:anti-sigma regulatory factor (Ser/Thr protein kinase)
MHTETEHVLRFPGTTEGFAGAAKALRALLDGRDLHPRHRHDVELVFDEIATNIVNHGRPTGMVEAVIRFGAETTLTFEDDGIAFDPRAQPAPPVATRRSDLRIGGLGLVIVRDLCTRFDYERTAEQRNRLTLTIPAVERDLDSTAEIPAQH